MTNLASCRSSRSSWKMRLTLTHKDSQSSYMIQRCTAETISSCTTSSDKKWRRLKRAMTWQWKSLRWIRRLQKLSPNFWSKMKKIGPAPCLSLECRRGTKNLMWDLAPTRERSSSNLTLSACHALETRMKWRRPSSSHVCPITLSRYNTERGGFREISYWLCWITWLLNHRKSSTTLCKVRTGSSNMRRLWSMSLRSLKSCSITLLRRKRFARSSKLEDQSLSLTICTNWWIVQLRSNY